MATRPGTVSTPALATALQNGRILGLPYGAIAERFIANDWYVKADWMTRHREIAMTRAVFAERFEPGLIQPVIDVAARYKAIPASFPATELYEAAL